MTLVPNVSTPCSIGVKRVIMQIDADLLVAAQALRDEVRRADEARTQRIHHAVARSAVRSAASASASASSCVSQQITWGLMA